MAYQRKTPLRTLYCLNCGAELPNTAWSYKIKYPYCKEAACQAVRSEERRKRNVEAVRKAYKKNGDAYLERRKEEPPKADRPQCRWPGCTNPAHTSGLVEYRHCKRHLAIINQREARLADGCIYHTYEVTTESVFSLLDGFGTLLTNTIYGD